MFTGIVEELGTLRTITRATGAGHAVEFEIESVTVLDDVDIGASIAVNGCCLTVTAFGDRWWRTELSAETLDRTALGALKLGDQLNLERPLAVGARLGGHVVLGHVDGVGEILALPPDLRVRIPERLARYLVEKGSIAIDGISLTAFDLAADANETTFTVAVIPHTADVTNLGHRAIGDLVNIEVDILAKHVERLLDATAVTATAP